MMELTVQIAHLLALAYRLVSACRMAIPKIIVSVTQVWMLVTAYRYGRSRKSASKAGEPGKCSAKSEANVGNRLWQGETHVTRHCDLERECLEHLQNKSMAWPL